MGVFKRTIKNIGGNKRFYWYIDYVVDGKRKWESVGAVGEVSKADARKLLALRKTEILQGKFSTAKPKVSPTFHEHSKEYLQFARVNKKSWERDKYSLIKLEPFFGDYRLSEISPILIERYKLERKEVVSPRTVNIELALLKRMFSLAVSWDRCKDNPMYKIKLFKDTPPKERILTEDEETSLLEASPDHLRPILVTALQTGLRYGEVLKLFWGDVDLFTGYINVRQSKSGNGRKIPINQTLRKTLKGLISGDTVSNSVGRQFKMCKNYNECVVKSDVPNWIQDPVGASSWGFKSPLRHGLFR